MKKIVLVLLACVLSLGMFAFVGCNSQSQAENVMNVSLNPEVEFILDGNNKVLTVNALNEEGNLIVSAELFKNIEGKSAEEAAKLFVQVSAETGYLVTGRVGEGENQISISISGDAQQAQKLFDSVKTKVDSYFNAQNIQATLQQAQAITREQLEQLLLKCEPYLEEAQVKALEYKELLAELAQSRKETAEMYSQELKNAYYEAKAFALDQAKYEVLKEHLNTVEQAIVEGLNSAYVSYQQTLEQLRNDKLVSENSAYQKALANLREKKAEYLNYRNEVAQMEQTAVTEVVSAHLATLQSALETAENALLSAGATANALIDSAKTSAEQAYQAIMSAFDKLDTDALVDEIATKQTAQAEEFFNKFEADYKTATEAAKANWNAMEQALRNGESVEG